MKKQLFLIVLCLAILLSFAACGLSGETQMPTDPTKPTSATVAPTQPTTVPTEPTTMPTDPTEHTSATSATSPALENGVFDTKNIVRITFYLYYGMFEGSDVPEAYMDTVIAWLGTFTAGEEAEYPVRPGTNTRYVEIEYADGTVVKNGLDTVTVNGKEYHLKKAAEPDCITEIISKIPAP